jgi:membrane fusion protein (multidrug efflux system)
LTTISDISPIWVRFSLSDSELTSLGGKLSEKNVKKITLVLSNGQQFDEEGKLNFASSTIDPNLGTQLLRAEFKNANHQLLPGQFVRVRITTGTREGVFLVPQTAVLTGEQGKFVLVADKDATGKMVAGVRKVQDAGWEGKNWVILSGLKSGEQVIIDNLIKVRPGAPVNPHPFDEAPAKDKTQEALKAH